MAKVCIIGTTTWGMTLATMLGRKKLQVRLWARTKEEATRLKSAVPNPRRRLPSIILPSHIQITSSLRKALDGVNAVILAVPSQTMRQNISLIKDYLGESTIVASAAKGLEIESNKRMSEVIAEEIDSKFHSNICVISGPNLSKEIMNGSPAATVVAAEDEAIARKVQRMLENSKFCVFTNTDVIGVALGGALKNVIALRAGIADGLGYGDNAKAVFITRGLTEITALGVALKANPLTFSGLAGLGDMIATCASPLSRNHYVGVELAKGRPLQEILDSMNEVAEGVPTTKVAWHLAQEHGVEMPITQKVYQVLYEGLSPEQAVDELMGARTRNELSGRKWNLLSFLRRRRKSKVAS